MKWVCRVIHSANGKLERNLVTLKQRPFLSFTFNVVLHHLSRFMWNILHTIFFTKYWNKNKTKHIDMIKNPIDFKSTNLMFRNMI